MNTQRISGMLALFLGLTAAAQRSLTLTLQQAMDMAAQQSFAVRSSLLESQKAEARIKEAQKLGLKRVVLANAHDKNPENKGLDVKPIETIADLVAWTASQDKGLRRIA